MEATAPWADIAVMNCDVIHSNNEHRSKLGLEVEIPRVTNAGIGVKDLKNYNFIFLIEFRLHYAQS